MPILISTSELADQLRDPALVIADVRWDPSDPEAAINSYRQGHIPGAIYFDLDRDLSDRSDLSRGRHPLPDPHDFAQLLMRRGIGPDTRLVVYDDKLESLAVRLWWMMRWIGGPEAALLDGGLDKWVHERRPIEEGPDRDLRPAHRAISVNLNPSLIARITEIESASRGGMVLLDARAPERYRGEVEPIDTRAGHIPAAVNAPWTENLSGTTPQVFKSPAELRSHYEKLGVTSGADVVCYCGSGATACHDVFALGLAGFHRVRLYPGSWSEWIAQHP